MIKKLLLKILGGVTKKQYDALHAEHEGTVYVYKTLCLLLASDVDGGIKKRYLQSLFGACWEKHASRIPLEIDKRAAILREFKRHNELNCEAVDSFVDTERGQGIYTRLKAAPDAKH